MNKTLIALALIAGALTGCNNSSHWKYEIGADGFPNYCKEYRKLLTTKLTAYQLQSPSVVLKWWVDKSDSYYSTKPNYMGWPSCITDEELSYELYTVAPMAAQERRDFRAFVAGAGGYPTSWARDYEEVLANVMTKRMFADPAVAKAEYERSQKRAAFDKWLLEEEARAEAAAKKQHLDALARELGEILRAIPKTVVIPPKAVETVEAPKITTEQVTISPSDTESVYKTTEDIPEPAPVAAVTLPWSAPEPKPKLYVDPRGAFSYE